MSLLPKQRIMQDVSILADEDVFLTIKMPSRIKYKKNWSQFKVSIQFIILFILILK